MKRISYQPLIIIGAPRSGTNMLRDALCSVPGIATWPCDEINAVWRHGHLRNPYDDFAPDTATPELSRFVRRRFEWLASKTGAHIIVEKTCANSLRVAYLRNLLPEAKFIYIHRDGTDAVASAIRRWTGGVSLSYVLKKLRFVPVQDLPFHIERSLIARLRQRVDPNRRLRAWGPMTAEVAQAAQNRDVARAAAIQWRQCVERALDQAPSNLVATIRYEDFVRRPVKLLATTLAELGLRPDDSVIARAITQVRDDKVGRGKAELQERGVAHEVREEIGSALRRLNYGVL